MRGVIIYLSRRFLRALVTVWGCVTLVFIALQFAGSPVATLLPSEADFETYKALEGQLGLDRPLHEQYIDMLVGIPRGDFGISFRLQQPAGELVLDRLVATMKLVGLSFLVAVTLSIPIGLSAAWYKDTAYDFLITSFSFLGFSIPSFWLGAIAIILFAVNLKWLPTSGMGSWKHFVLPVTTLAAWPLGQLVMLIRSEMVAVLGEDYIRTARAKGVKESSVMLIHAFKNASIAVLTMTGLILGQLMGGVIVTEIVYAWPGMGRLAVTAIFDRDWPVVQASVIYAVIVFVAINLTVDLLYSVLDPRIRVD